MKPLSDWEVRDIVENEGMCYTFTQYLNPADIESDELREYAEALDEAYENISEYLANLEGT